MRLKEVGKRELRTSSPGEGTEQEALQTAATVELAAKGRKGCRDQVGGTMSRGSTDHTSAARQQEATVCILGKDWGMMAVERQWYQDGLALSGREFSHLGLRCRG